MCTPKALKNLYKISVWLGPGSDPPAGDRDLLFCTGSLCHGRATARLKAGSEVGLAPEGLNNPGHK